MTRTISLEVREISKAYMRGPERVEALRDVTFSVEEGELVAVMGPSGSGKTTLLNLIAGWETPDSGWLIWFADDSFIQSRGLYWNDLGIVPQTMGLLEELTVRENILLPARLAGLLPGMRKVVDELLDNLGLNQLENRYPAEISMGEQQRTAVARALALQPRLVLADEPTGHQDAVSARGVFRTLRAYCGGRGACVVATHNVEVLKYVDRVIALRDGRLVEEPILPISGESP